MSGAGAVAFITGCGRSGTTILGTILSKHPHVTYLNDRFDLWLGAFPVCDIWEMRGGAGRVALDECDATPDRRDRFLAALEAARRDRPLVVEKLAINNFRLAFLRALRPEAPLINIVRHGVEVAHSIAGRAAAGQWYGTGERKWALLAEHARSVGLGGLVERCAGAYERGLLEWRLSVEAAERFVARARPARFMQVRYEDMLADPARLCDRLEEFLALPRCGPMKTFAAAEVRRRSPAADERTIPASTEPIAGECLRRLGYAF